MSRSTIVANDSTRKHATSAIIVPMPIPLGSATLPPVRTDREVVRRTGVTGRDSGDGFGETGRAPGEGLTAALGGGGGGFAAGFGAGALGFIWTVDVPSSTSLS